MLQESRSFKIIKAPSYGKIKNLRPGFTETIPHPMHGAPIPRCQAAKKRTEGKIQCSKFSLKNNPLCRTHGGAIGSGVQSPEGRQNQIAAVTKHGHETRAKRSKRSAASKELKLIEKLGKVIGLINSGGPDQEAVTTSPTGKVQPWPMLVEKNKTNALGHTTRKSSAYWRF
jgi:hypothetical protein